MQPINKIARKLNIPLKFLEFHGDYIAKIKAGATERRKRQGRLVLVTAMTPTKAGEGKTTVAIGIADALSRLDKRTVLCLREPSLGPYFSLKGGASGGGLSTVEPAEEINLHFTGDIHAVTSAHNLIAAEIDNHIYWGNRLKIKKVFWKRAIDLCDRGLRNNFNITASSEIMAVLCLSKTRAELKRRLGDIVIAESETSRPVTVRRLSGLDTKLALLLKRAFMPNLVQTRAGTPALIHGGPFANVAHGTNSIAAIELALKYSDFTVIEAGFGTELGAFKFADIVNRRGIPINTVIIVATLRAINKYGEENLNRHINNIRKLGGDPIVVLNKFSNDSLKKINYLNNYYDDHGISFLVSDSYKRGAAGANSIAWAIIDSADKKIKINRFYELNDPAILKIEKLSENIFGAGKVELSAIAKKKLALFKKWGYGRLPICIAKTQYAIGDNKKRPNARNFTLKVTDVSLSAGAGFIVVYCGKILLMPGMPKR